MTGMPTGFVASAQAQQMQPQHMHAAQQRGHMTGAALTGYGHGIGPQFWGMPAVMPAAQGAIAEGRYQTPWRVVVHNLPWETSAEELFAAFTSWNPQDANIMKDRTTGYSK